MERRYKSLLTVRRVAISVTCIIACCILFNIYIFNVIGYTSSPEILKSWHAKRRQQTSESKQLSRAYNEGDYDFDDHETHWDNVGSPDADIFDRYARNYDDVEHREKYSELEFVNDRMTTRLQNASFGVETADLHKPYKILGNLLRPHGVSKPGIGAKISLILPQGSTAVKGLGESKFNSNAPIRIKNTNNRSFPFDTDGLGEMGRGVATLPEHKSMVDDAWKLAQFNQYVSDMISVERSLPDTRHAKCSAKLYDYNSLPRASIIICFTDESWSTLLRTIHSVLNRTPPELLTEVLLVDDFSSRAHLQQSLDDYLASFPVVRLIRLSHRYGLVRARLAGVDQALGPVILFLDSHVECNVGWIEPLLDAIAKNRKAVVSPLIDTIDAASFSYNSAPEDMRGSFTWNLDFIWRDVPDYEKRRRRDPSEALRSPVIAGGLFAIDRKYFFEIGTYDPGLEIWGAENLEISFKTWMCGGSLELIPCSRVGHIFRHQAPYDVPGNKDSGQLFLENSVRVAKVWMDDYKELFFRFNPAMEAVDVGDTSHRKRIRQNLRCKSFKWYLDNISPELHVPSFQPIAHGRVIHTATGKCLTKEDDLILLSPCFDYHWFSQIFQLRRDKRLEMVESCVGSTKLDIKAVDCNSELVLKLDHSGMDTALFIMYAQLCLAPRVEIEHSSTLKLELAPCSTLSLDQRWSFEHYYNFD